MCGKICLYITSIIREANWSVGVLVLTGASFDLGQTGDSLLSRLHSRSVRRLFFMEDGIRIEVWNWQWLNVIVLTCVCGICLPLLFVVFQNGFDHLCTIISNE